MYLNLMGKKKHTPGRSHRRKSDPQKSKRFQRRAARKREAAEKTLSDAWDLWDGLSVEQKKILSELMPKKPRPPND
jgi:hypothetical protein